MPIISLPDLLRWRRGTLKLVLTEMVSMLADGSVDFMLTSVDLDVTEHRLAHVGVDSKLEAQSCDPTERALQIMSAFLRSAAAARESTGDARPGRNQVAEMATTERGERLRPFVQVDVSNGLRMLDRHGSTK